MSDENGLSLDALRLLTEVARLGSFTAAAAELNYTQSAVSRRIAGLERAAGGPLFERLPRGVRLTPTGEALHRHARAVLSRIAEAGSELAAIRKGYGGRVRLGAFATANAGLVPDAVRSFQERRADVEVTIREGLSAALLSDLECGDLDVAVVSDYPSGVPRAGGIELNHVMDDEFQVAIAGDRPLAARARLALRDLRDEPWIQAAPLGIPTRLSEACARNGFAPRLGPRVAEWTGKFGFVAAGLGVTLVPRLIAHAVPPGVVLRDLSPGVPPRRIYAALREPGLAAARAFAALLAESVP